MPTPTEMPDLKTRALAMPLRIVLFPAPGLPTRARPWGLGEGDMMVGEEEVKVEEEVLEDDARRWSFS